LLVWFGRAGGRLLDEDVPVRRRRPRFVVWTFKLDRADQEARHVPAIGVFAANGNFVDPGEVVDVVVFDDRRREVVDCSFEDVLCQLLACDGLRRADGGEGTAAVAAQTKVNADAGLALFERQKAPGQVVIRGERG
jgi:hypothetical protein